MSNALGQALGVKFITTLLGVGIEAFAELQKVDTYHFNVFTLRETTDGNELETILPFILAKHNLFANNKVQIDSLRNFVR